MYCKYVNNKCEGPAVHCRLIKKIENYVVREKMLEKRKYDEIQYNTDNIQMLCITNLSYSLLPNIKRTYNQIDLIEK